MLIRLDVIRLEDNVETIEALSEKWNGAVGVSYRGKFPVFKFYIEDIGTPEKPIENARYVEGLTGEYAVFGQDGSITIHPDIFNIKRKDRLCIKSK